MQTEANGINNGIITETGTTEMGGGLASDIPAHNSPAMAASFRT